MPSEGRRGLHCSLIALICLFAVQSLANGPPPGSYRAAVFQHSPVGTPPYHSEAVIKANFEIYNKVVMEAAEQAVNIIVFPEGGLGWLFAEIPNTRDAMFPYCEEIPSAGTIVSSSCGANDSTSATNFSQIGEASCMSQKAGMIVAINMCELQYCNQKTDPNCPSDGRYQWNTDVIFSEEGVLLAKYHKSHLFGGSAVFNQPVTPDVVSFNTSFGITFGVFICYDVDFTLPIETLLSEGITNFVFSTAWVNSPPLQTAVQIQQGWSRIYNVNMLASNSGSSPYVAGCGIYSAGIPLNVSYEISTYNIQQLLISDVPNQPQAPRAKPFLSLESQSVQKQVVPLTPCYMEELPMLVGNCAFIKTSDVNDSSMRTIESSYSGISCALNYSIVNAGSEKHNPETYALFAADSSLEFPYTPDGLTMEVCAFVHCSDPPNCSPSFWKSNPASPPLFHLALEGSGFSSNITVFPFVAVNNSQVIHPDLTEFTEVDEKTRTLATVSPLTDALFNIILYGVGPY